jgi:hypothetical protein
VLEVGAVAELEGVWIEDTLTGCACAVGSVWCPPSPLW